MGQNNIWIRYSLIGTIGSLLICFASCVKHEFVHDAEFYFINKTDHHISYNYGLDKYNLNPSETRVFREEQGSVRNIDKATFSTPFKVTTFDVTLTFDGTKCLVVSPTGTFGPLNIKNYVAEKTGKRAYKFTYTFTEEDYNRATPCP